GLACRAVSAVKAEAAIVGRLCQTPSADALFDWTCRGRRHPLITLFDRTCRACRAVTLRTRVAHSTFELPMAETSAAVIASPTTLSVKSGTQVVLDGATFPSTEGEHIGLVGRNGSGKSTFLQIAAGVAQADSGEFSCRRDLVTGYMPQVSGLDDA